MKEIKPQEKLLDAWRTMLILLSAPPAFLCTFLLRVPSLAWVITIGIWCFLFLFLHLYYLPALWRGLSLSVRERSLCLKRGVFLQKSSVLAFDSVRFTQIVRGPVQLIFGFCTLHIAAAGGGFFVPGLSREDANELCVLLHRGGGATL